MRRRYTLLGRARVNIGVQACSVHAWPFSSFFCRYSTLFLYVYPFLSLSSLLRPPFSIARSIDWRQSRLFRTRDTRYAFDLKYVPRAVDATEKVQRTYYLLIIAMQFVKYAVNRRGRPRYRRWRQETQRECVARISREKRKRERERDYATYWSHDSARQWHSTWKIIYHNCSIRIYVNSTYVIQRDFFLLLYSRITDIW